MSSLQPSVKADGAQNTQLTRVESLLSAERRTVEMVAGGARLAEILQDLCATIDAQDLDIISTILLADCFRLRGFANSWTEPLK